jgi:membrane protease YdiL (CAAX protease family)
MNDGAEIIDKYINTLWVALLLSLPLIAIAWKKGFFHFTPSALIPIRGADVFQAFALFIFVQVALMPAALFVLFSLTGEGVPQNLSLSLQGWINVLNVEGTFLAIFIFYLSLSRSLRHQIWGDSSLWYRHLLIGITTWFLSYPIVLVFNQLMSLMVWVIFQQEPTAQVAVKNFAQILSHPFLFWTMTLVVTCIVPMVEELLFRGFLQSWLRRKFHSSLAAIALTSIIFAFFHYSTSQGVSNIELISSLFVLSCFLGYLYERQHSLWASIGLHGFFNGMSVLMITQAQNL